MTTEVAMAVVLAVGAGLMVRSVANLLAIDPGFSARGVLTSLSTPSTWYPDSLRVTSFWDELQRRTRALPGVRAAGAARVAPTRGGNGRSGTTGRGIYATAELGGPKATGRWLRPDTSRR
ncbi:MAG: hypothetical protein U0163_05045 [Gemmatimonadaceae bacterium]